jgi:short-subunit dehydrogenase
MHHHHEGDFRGQVAVVTGASAGVGRATAERLGRLGAKVALIGRDAEALEAAAREIDALGTETLALPLDVADAEAVFAAAERIERELGPIDVWVNNAMVTVFSPVSELTPEEVRRVTEVTYLGAVHGTMAALRHMRVRDRGVIVQVGSSLSYRGIPLQAAYCGAKHAMRGFTDSLRGELLHERSGVALSMVQLPAVNTPQFDWARTHRRHQPRPVAPVYAPEAAARAVVAAAANPAREYWVGGRTLLMIMANMVAPSLFDQILARQAIGGQDRDAEVAPDRKDNLFEPVHGLHGAEGSFGDEARPDAAVIAAPAGRLGAVAGAGLLVAGLAGLALASLLAPAERHAPPLSRR